MILLYARNEVICVVFTGCCGRQRAANFSKLLRLGYSCRFLPIFLRPVMTFSNPDRYKGKSTTKNNSHAYFAHLSIDPDYPFSYRLRIAGVVR